MYFGLVVYVGSQLVSVLEWVGARDTHLARKRMYLFTNSADFFFNIVQNTFEPPPFVLIILEDFFDGLEGT